MDVIHHLYQGTQLASQPDIQSNIQIAGKCYNLNEHHLYFRIAKYPKSGDFRFLIKLEFEDILDTERQKEVASIVSAEQVEDIRRQLLIADALYRKVLGLNSPLSQTRYHKARMINVNFVVADKAYGRAYDEVVKNNNSKDASCFIMMSISNKVYANKNVTPAHELFHLYQNSTIMFKQGWMSEGLARWSETLFNEGSGMNNDTVLPQNKEELEDVMKTTYAASTMWVRLFQLIDDNPNMNVPVALSTKRYTDNQLIIKDNKAYGTNFIKILFNELAKQSMKVSVLNGWEIYGWKEKDQKDPSLDPYVWQAVKDAVNRAVPKHKQSDELRKFLAIEMTR